MLKKASIFLLATLYFICATGIYVHAHFCADELSSVSYFALNDDHSCGCGDEALDTDCCKDVFHFHKVDSHQDASFIKSSDAFSLKVISHFKHLNYCSSHFVTFKAVEPHKHAPPPFLYAKANKLIVNSVFRI
jgi:hypothetical protein